VPHPQLLPRDNCFDRVSLSEKQTINEGFWAFALQLVARLELVRNGFAALNGDLR
jgi:hypothetical protein